MFSKIMIAAALAGGALGGLALSASAAPLDEATTGKVQVTFADRDLKDPARAGAVYDRLYTAAQEACDSKEPGPAWRAADDRLCEQQAMDEAVSELGSGEVSRRHREATAAPQVASAARSH